MNTGGRKVLELQSGQREELSEESIQLGFHEN